MYKDFINNNSDQDPLYSEVEYELLNLDDDSDPLLVEEDTHHAINWNELLSKINNILSKNKDLRVIIWRLRVGLHVEGVSSLYINLKMLESVIVSEDEKDTITDEEKEHIANFAAQLGWISTSQCIIEVKESFLTPDLKLTVKSILDIDNAQKENNHSFADIITTYKKMNDYFAENNLPNILEQLLFNVDLLEKIENFVNDYSNGYKLDCRFLIGILKKLINKFNSFVEQSIQEDEDVFADDDLKNSDSNFKGLSSSGNKRRGKMQAESRSEAIILLENVLQYFRNYEPSHPAPIFIKRAQKMIGMDFESIVKELLPDSMNMLNVYTGLENNEYGNNDEYNNE